MGPCNLEQSSFSKRRPALVDKRHSAFTLRPKPKIASPLLAFRAFRLHTARLEASFHEWMHYRGQRITS